MRWIIKMLVSMAFTTAALGSEVSDYQAAATQALGESNYEVALKHLDAALKAEPDNAYSNYLVALVHLDGKIDLGLAKTHLDLAQKGGAEEQAVALLRARLHAIEGKTEKALAELESLAEAGYAQLARIESQSDFDPLRSQPGFEEALESIRAARYPCEADERHHHFDFWVGDWSVYQNGTFAGDNRISSILGGCLIFEQWESAAGSQGKSFNYFDPGKNHWRQIWVADTGTIIEFTGHARDGGIYYTAETEAPGTGDLTFHRFEFTEHPEGGVRQFWAISPDQEEWSTIWDGHYVKKNGGATSGAPGSPGR